MGDREWQVGDEVAVIGRGGVTRIGELPAEYRFVFEGARVWYQSSPHHRHAGVVIGEPRPCRDGFTVAVGELDPPVQKASGDSRVIRAAWIGALSPRLDDADKERLARGLLRKLVEMMGGESQDPDPLIYWHAGAMLSGRTDLSGWDAEAARQGIGSVADEVGLTLEWAPGESRWRESPRD